MPHMWLVHVCWNAFMYILVVPTREEGTDLRRPDWYWHPVLLPEHCTFLSSQPFSGARPHPPSWSSHALVTPDGWHGLWAAGWGAHLPPDCTHHGGQVPSVRMAATRSQMGGSLRQSSRQVLPCLWSPGRPPLSRQVWLTLKYPAPLYTGHVPGHGLRGVASLWWPCMGCSVLPGSVDIRRASA